MRLIDADALIERWNNMSVRGRTEFDQEIMVAPSIDIVRCRECEHFFEHIGIRSICVFHLSIVNADDFCSYGSRSEKPNNLERSE